MGPQLSRRAFTLVELLIVITIIAILAGLVVGVAAVAAQTGREAKTRNIVGRIHTLLTEHYNSYANRRVELNPQITNAINALNATPQQKGVITQAARLYALREMMLLEIPDRWSDVWLQDLPTRPGSSTPVPSALNNPAYLPARTALSQNYLRRFLGLYNNRINSVTNQVNTREDILANQSAECLYMVVITACGDGEARTLFHENDIGDVDGDGAPEFLDAWGHPISFFRWAPGFSSQIQGNANLLPQPPPTAPNTNLAWEEAAAADHDPFDLFRVDIKAFRLQPLVYSAGRDEQLGIEQYPDVLAWNPRITLTFTAAYPYCNPPLDPYRPTAATPSMYFGTAIPDAGATDNIHNHAFQRRLTVQR